MNATHEKKFSRLKSVCFYNKKTLTGGKFHKWNSIIRIIIPFDMDNRKTIKHNTRRNKDSMQTKYFRTALKGCWQNDGEKRQKLSNYSKPMPCRLCWELAPNHPLLPHPLKPAQVEFHLPNRYKEASKRGKGVDKGPEWWVTTKNSSCFKPRFSEPLWTLN